VEQAAGAYFAHADLVADAPAGSELFARLKA
jgi:hypothetical protein